MPAAEQVEEGASGDKTAYFLDLIWSFYSNSSNSDLLEKRLDVAVEEGSGAHLSLKNCYC